MFSGFVIGTGIMIVGAYFIITGEYINGITLILVGCVWIDTDRINSELADLKKENAELRKVQSTSPHKQENILIS